MYLAYIKIRKDEKKNYEKEIFSTNLWESELVDQEKIDLYTANRNLKDN